MTNKVMYGIVSCFIAMSLCACNNQNTDTETTTDSAVEIESVSLTQESEEEIASRTRDVTVISSRDAVSVSVAAAKKVLAERGFENVTLLVEGADGADNGSVAKDDASALELVGWWVDNHDRVWALHVVSGDFFASRVWLDTSEQSDMLVVEGDRVTMYNADLQRLVKIGVSEIEAEGVQVVHVDKLDAATLGSVEVAS